MCMPFTARLQPLAKFLFSLANKIQKDNIVRKLGS